MPSGITHILLVKTLNENSSHQNEDLKALLDDKLKILQLGALAPDLAYSQATPITDLFGNEDTFADLFHYENTNQIPLRAFEIVRNLPSGNNKDVLFSFFLGYVSHLVADGIIHPFVRDKVGNYKDACADHRALEMRLDAIFLHSLTRSHGTSVDVNIAGIQDQIGDVKNEDLSDIANLFSDLINEVYGKKIAPHRIVNWVSDLKGIFNTAANENNCYYAYIPGLDKLLYNDTSKVLLQKEKDLWLRKSEAIGRTQNFLGKDVHFLNDCIPQFYRYFNEVALALYLYCYENGPSLSHAKLEAINLDTGRPLLANQGNDLDSQVAYWSVV